MVSNSCILDTGHKRIVHPKVRTIKSSPGSEVHKLWPECAWSTKGCKDHRYQWYRIFYPSLIYGAVFMFILHLYINVAGLLLRAVGRFLASLLCMSKYPSARCWTQLLLMHTNNECVWMLGVEKTVLVCPFLFVACPYLGKKHGAPAFSHYITSLLQGKTAWMHVSSQFWR